MSTRTDPGLPAGAVAAAEWADVGHPRQFRLFNGRKRVVTWRDAESGTPGQAELYVAGSQLADGSLEGPRHVRISGVGWEDAIPADAARELARAFAELAAEIEAVEK
ncbi:hypothetical protein FIV07_12260 [Mycobacterium sp. THAF192]|nr:hypothetical protein FIV07_12260 [Mycobacterium sp. THAF192]